MTAPLNTILKTGEKVHIKVDKQSRDVYFPDFLHDMIGDIWEIDDEHIYIMSQRTNKTGDTFVTGPHRYCWLDITVERI